MSKPVRNLFSSADLENMYPDDDACLHKIFQMTYGRMEKCPKCKSTIGYVRVKNRRAYQCRKCYNQVYPTVHTIFHKTKIPLKDWFRVIFSFCISKNGYSALEVSREIKVSAKTALRILNKIREALVQDAEMMRGIVEIDETFVGGKNKNRHYDKKVEKCQGRSYKDKVPVLGMIEHGSGRAYAVVLENVKGKTLQPILLNHIEVGSTLLTDEYKGYKNLYQYYDHRTCNHSRKQFMNSGATTNRVENLWSCLKRNIHGSYIKVSKKNLHLYVNETIFKYNNRESPDMFHTLLNSVFEC